jgi:hypothetical protein
MTPSETSSEKNIIDIIININFCTTVYNEQLYCMIVWSKLALFSPWAKKHSQLKFLVNFFSLGKKGTPIQPFMIHIYFLLTFFLLEVPEGPTPTVTIMQSRGADTIFCTTQKFELKKAERLKIIFNYQHDT